MDTVRPNDLNGLKWTGISLCLTVWHIKNVLHMICNIPWYHNMFHIKHKLYNIAYASNFKKLTLSKSLLGKFSFDGLKLESQKLNYFIQITMVFLNTSNLNQYHQSTTQNALTSHFTILMIINGKLHHHGTPKKTSHQLTKFQTLFKSIMKND